jgi:hypothetical protein
MILAASLNRWSQVTKASSRDPKMALAVARWTASNGRSSGSGNAAEAARTASSIS